VNVQVGPVVVARPSLMVVYHSYRVFSVKPGQGTLALDPEGTLPAVPITWKELVCMAYGNVN